jgi:hypothetical protein
MFRRISASILRSTAPAEWKEEFNQDPLDPTFNTQNDMPMSIQDEIPSPLKYVDVVFSVKGPTRYLNSNADILSHS